MTLVPPCRVTENNFNQIVTSSVPVYMKITPSSLKGFIVWQNIKKTVARLDIVVVQGRSIILYKSVTLSP